VSADATRSLRHPLISFNDWLQFLRHNNKISFSQEYQPCSSKQRVHFRCQQTHSKTTQISTIIYNLLTSLLKQIHRFGLTFVRQQNFYVLFHEESNTDFSVFSVTTNSRLQTDASRKCSDLIPLIRLI
jgi:hypothetical protein